MSRVIPKLPFFAHCRCRFASKFDPRNKLSAYDTFNVLASLAAVMRIVLVALDDSELYALGVRCGDLSIMFQ
jgi:hypothetical protein